MNRSFKLNETQWQGQPAGFWRLAVKNVSEVDIQTQSGKVNWAKVTYEAILSNDGYYTQAGVWEKTGWEAQIPLIAPKYVAGVPFAAGTVLKFVGTNSEPKMGFINTDGTEDAAATRPKFKFHNRYETIEFSDFLQDF